MAIRLSELILKAKLDITLPFEDVEITAVTDHSSKVIPGSLFVAIEGVAADGHAFMSEAVRNGAVAIIGSQHRSPKSNSAIYLHTSNPRRALARLLHAFHDFPMRGFLVIGVTGTTGKSTTVHLVEAILAAGGRRPGLIGTIEYHYGAGSDPAAHTTPHPAVLVEYALDMRRAGLDALAIEVSSHALVQERVECVPFRVAVLTNIGHDHLDFHQTRESYIEAKWKFFGEVLPRALGEIESSRGVAVFNLDDAVGAEFHRRYKGEALTYGRHSDADVRPLQIESDRGGIRIEIAFRGQHCTARSRLCGDFNVANILAAAAAGLAAGFPLTSIAMGIESVSGVRGRFERVQTDAPFDIYVDFAHQPESLDRLLASAKQLAAGGRLFCVFGAGGDRDPTKREPMSEAVARWADRAIITKDNSRSEDPRKITSALAKGMERAASPRCHYDVILDRREAIRTALSEARLGDLVVIAGKGHELYEHEGNELRPWDDRQVARELWIELKEGKHPARSNELGN